MTDTTKPVEPVEARALIDKVAAFINLFDHPQSKLAVTALRQQSTALDAANAEIERLKGQKWAAQHTDTMNDLVQMGMARDEAVARAEKAEAELDQAYEVAADKVECCAGCQDDIRNLTPADATAALEAYGAAKVREGMQAATAMVERRLSELNDLHPDAALARTYLAYALNDLAAIKEKQP